MLEPKQSLADFRIRTYKISKRVLFIVLILLMVKVSFFDTAVISGKQMSPVLLPGDRVLVLKFPFHPLFRSFFRVKTSQTVLFQDKDDPTVKGCLNIAGLSSDTISITDGTLYNSTTDDSLNIPHNEIIPSNYSPRDNFRQYRIPSPGDTLKFDSLSFRDFFFAASVTKQENPLDTFTVVPSFFVGDSLAESIHIKDFSLYKGYTDSIPENLKNDWFFWDRMREYLNYRHGGKRIYIQFSLLKNGNRIDSHIVNSSFCFMIAQNWEEGLDSRYFGPIKTSLIRGKIFAVLWSRGENGTLPGGIRISRIGKLIR
jgi:signal peptidase I